MDLQVFDLDNPSFDSARLGKLLLEALSSEDTKLSLPELMKYLGEACACERTYIFEIDYQKSNFSNTYEWCAEGVTPQKDNLQNEDLKLISSWLEMFHKKQPVIIPCVDDIKNIYPIVYATLKAQHIDSLISVPLYADDELLGFLGIDNPDFSNNQNLASFLYKIGKLVSHIIRTRNINTKIHYFKYHDQLTLAYNRAALDRDFGETSDWTKLGIVSCDISELKKTNDSLGYKAGDSMICQCNEILSVVFDNYKIYRISGDRFVAVCPNVESGYFEEIISNLETSIATNNFNIVYGFTWSDTSPLEPYKVLEEAEKALHNNKSIFFNEVDPASGKSRNRRLIGSNPFFSIFDDKHNSLLYRFIENNYFSLDMFFSSLSVGEQYPFFGDVQKDTWFVSDTMKESWGFENNVVYNLLNKWEAFIPYKEDLEIYRNDIQDMLTLHKNGHDLIYRVKDKTGEEFWIRCYGLMKWNEDKTIPLFFCGIVLKLSSAFLIDPITNFSKENDAIKDIGEILHSGSPATFICFRLNGFGEINEVRGRQAGNNLLKDIGLRLQKSFDDTVQFYRLDGLRFLMIASEHCGTSIEDLSKKIKNVVFSLYSEYNLPIRYPCSVGILGDIKPGSTAHEVMTNVISVLEMAKNSPEVDTIFNNQTMQHHREQKQMMMELTKDVTNDLANFRVVIQPIVSAVTHKIVGGELLIRWKYHGQDISPMIFIPYLEENNLIQKVGRWIFKQAVAQCKRINTHSPDFFLDFNVSYHQIRDEKLLPYMDSVLKSYNLEGSRLVMELTETHYNDNPIKLMEFIESCKKMGMRIALDDFGVGYSSLEMLVKYPANIVKLDRSLMKKMSDSYEISDFITTIVYACHKFGKLVCVEGVESDTELQIVTEASCDVVQGYYFYKPLELDEIYALFISDH